MTTTYQVVKAWTLSDKGKEMADGWDLLHGEEWCQRFALKRDALAAMRELQPRQGRPRAMCFMAALGPCGK